MPDINDLISQVKSSGLSKKEKDYLIKRIVREGPGFELLAAVKKIKDKGLENKTEPIAVLIPLLIIGTLVYFFLGDPFSKPAPKPSVIYYNEPSSQEQLPRIPTYSPSEAFSPAPKKWYEGGTLHRATIGEWWKASEPNRLATCGDFLAGLLIDGKLNLPVSDPDSFLPYAYGLVKCINSATKNIPEIKGQKVSSIAASCVVLLGWMD